jgi:hypothetical protein
MFVLVDFVSVFRLANQPDGRILQENPHWLQLPNLQNLCA